MKKWWLIVLVLCANLGYAQDGYVKGDLFIFTEAGYLVGGQITSNTFLYQSGLTFRAGVSKEIHPLFNVGVGVGMDSYDLIEFYPVFLKIDAKSGRNQTGYFTSHIGYSFANSENKESVLEQEFEGGGFLELGRSWRFNINDNLLLVSGFSFKHQFAVLELKNSVGDELDQAIDFDGVHFRIGIIIK